MGRQSRKHRERRNRAHVGPEPGRTEQLEEELRRIKNGDACFRTSRGFPEELRESNLEDILSFESVDTGTSLFMGLQDHGIVLPDPAKLDEPQSAAKAEEVLHALLELGIILIGYENMSARRFYATLWNQTLWEGCYIKKRNPGAFTIIDVSHSIPRSEILSVLAEIMKEGSVH